MTITIDCNSDEITISTNTNGKLEEVNMKCNSPYQTIEILQEIFHRLPNLTNITLEKIDEDYRTIVDEW